MTAAPDRVRVSGDKTTFSIMGPAQSLFLDPMDNHAFSAHSGEMPPGSPPPLAATNVADWPDGIDATLTVFYLALFFGIPLLGYVAMVADFRRYLRSLRRALVVVSQVVPTMPYWAVLQRPTCLQTLGLKLPCSEEDVLAAYRERAKDMHPDRGGDLEQFLRLQKHLEEALTLVRGE